MIFGSVVRGIAPRIARSFRLSAVDVTEAEIVLIGGDHFEFPHTRCIAIQDGLAQNRDNGG
jgi:hypothetical protein